MCVCALMSRVGTPTLTARVCVCVCVIEYCVTFTPQVDTSVGYTCGFQSLSQCYPRAGLGWLKRSDREARDYLQHLISDWYGCEVVRVIDCLPITKARDRRETPYGHLGYHPQNIAWCLNDPRLREWRFTRYIELLYIFASRAMMPTGSGALGGEKQLSIVYPCRQGKHRSVMWQAIEQSIVCALGGITCYEQAVCYAAQLQTGCQKGSGCYLCDPTNPDVRALLAAAEDEFYAVAMCVDAVLEASSS